MSLAVLLDQGQGRRDAVQGSNVLLNLRDLCSYTELNFRLK
jgi:hypothetical protein